LFCSLIWFPLSYWEKEEIYRWTLSHCHLFHAGYLLSLFNIWRHRDESYPPLENFICKKLQRTHFVNLVINLELFCYLFHCRGFVIENFYYFLRPSDCPIFGSCMLGSCILSYFVHKISIIL
jgi:hypothetical protein